MLLPGTSKDHLHMFLRDPRNLAAGTSLVHTYAYLAVRLCACVPTNSSTDLGSMVLLRTRDSSTDLGSLVLPRTRDSSTDLGSLVPPGAARAALWLDEEKEAASGTKGGTGKVGSPKSPGMFLAPPTRSVIASCCTGASVPGGTNFGCCTESVLTRS